MKSWGGYRAAALSVAAIGMDMRGPHVGLRVVVCAFHILFAGTLVLASVAFAAAPSKSFHFEHLGVEQGLSQESVFAILQDHQGFLWFGTQAGLNRFDGYRVTVYKSDPKVDNSLAGNWVDLYGTTTTPREYAFQRLIPHVETAIASGALRIAASRTITLGVKLTK